MDTLILEKGMRKGAKITAFLIFGISVLFGVLFLFGFVEFLQPPPSWLGNFSHNAKRLEQDTENGPFSFSLIADIRSTGEHREELLQKLIVENPSFVAILGDFVSSPHVNEYRFFNSEMNKLNPSCPVFLVPGNHDISSENPQTDRLYEQLWGPMNFFFHHRGCLFVFLNNAKRTSLQEGWQFLKNTLQTESRKSKIIFLFAHIPPFAVSKKDNSITMIKEYTPFLDLIVKYQIDYAFFGHLHDKRKIQIGNCILISLGSGGAKIRGDDSYHHALKVLVKDSVEVKDIFVDPMLGIEDRVEKFMFLRVYPFVLEQGLKIKDSLSLIFSH